ncbi:Hsp70 family protein [Pseudonocardia sp. DSM 110487]|uniref:Hsp70 family protein n=1 Tax=Pseudonocardia sp. DSM 110487 TaxID=2865833 RepID=UPI001C69E095|nr:Hsp70 family protein [Pseudonocardia sp. DSM 110487]QYN36696.1 Hsp70 family protein [Pseudonocardia sp. DSM 110487]
MSYQLGIDLGTTYTAAAVSRATEQQHADPEMVSLGDRSVQVPSVLYLAPDGGILVGEAAERRAATDPDRVVREFKRQLGDEIPLVVGGRPIPAHELAAMLVAWVVQRVAEREGAPARRIALTHPASWGPHKKDLLHGALAARGLNVTFLAEPQAAALSYAAAERVERGSTIAVYDLGGGTFDSAVVRKNGTFTLLGRPEGIDRLGGVDFDDEVFTHVREAIGGAFDQLDPADETVVGAVSRLRRECKEAKEALSADTEVRIAVLLPGLQTAVRLTRGEFEAMIRPQLEDSVDALHRAVASAGLAPSDLSAVLLVGGSSRIPLIAQLVSAAFDRPVAVDADPKNAIALGAALSISPRPESWPAANIPPVPPYAPPVPAPVPAALTTPLPPAADPPRPPVPSLPPTVSPPMPVGSGSRRPAVVFGAGGLLVAAAIGAALLYGPDNPNPAPTSGTATSAVEVPQLTDAPSPEPAAVENQGGNQAPAQNQGRVAPRQQNGGGRPAPQEQPDENDKPDPQPTTTTTTPPTSTPTTSTTQPPSTVPPPTQPPSTGTGTGNTGPSTNGQAGEELGGQQVPADNPSGGDPEDAPAT